MRDWIQQGAPLGINVAIPDVGVFPKFEDDTDPLTLTSVQEAKWAHFRNYSSMRDLSEDSNIELERVISSGFAARLPREAALDLFPAGAVSKMAVIVKGKAATTGDSPKKVKRLITVDLRRSGVNSRMKLHERTVLPRI